MALLNGPPLWRGTKTEMTRIQRVVANLYVLMGLVLRAVRARLYRS